MTAQLARDEYTLRAPHFTVKNMVLPEEKTNLWLENAKSVLLIYMRIHSN